MDNTYKNNQKPNSISKVSEPETEYIVNKKTKLETELHPILVKLIEIGKKQIELGQTKPHDQVMAEMKLKYNLK